MQKSQREPIYVFRFKIIQVINYCDRAGPGPVYHSDHTGRAGPGQNTDGPAGPGPEIPALVQLWA